MSWHYAKGTEQFGPVTDEAFSALISQGEVIGTTLVWKEGMVNWQPYSEIAALGAASGETCSVCGKLFPSAELLTFEGRRICVSCKPAFFQKVKEGVEIVDGFKYGSFGARFGAKIIDGILLYVVNLAVTAIIYLPAYGTFFTPKPTQINKTFWGIQGIVFLITTLIRVLYNAWFISAKGATPGKKWLKLRVIRSDGSPVTFARAVGRAFAEILSGLILSIGYLMAAWDDEARTLHDRICDTRVISTKQ